MIRNRSFLLLLFAGAALLVAGCHGDADILSAGDGFADGTSSIQLASADIRIDDRSVNGATIPAGLGASSLFTVTLADPARRSEVLTVQMDYSTHSSMGMMSGRQSVECYDDGTHGDRVAGDGTYSYMDADRHIGPHYENCASGSYVYTFHGTDRMGQHTNAIECWVTVN